MCLCDFGQLGRVALINHLLSTLVITYIISYHLICPRNPPKRSQRFPPSPGPQPWYGSSLTWRRATRIGMSWSARQRKMYVALSSIYISSDASKYRIPRLTARLPSSSVLLNELSLPFSRLTKKLLENALRQSGTRKFSFYTHLYIIDLSHRLKKLYRTHATSLIQTRGGVDPDKAIAALGDNAHHEYSDCYIPASGPDASTTERAKNIWRQFDLILYQTYEI